MDDIDKLLDEHAIDGLSKLHLLVYRLMPRDTGIDECVSSVPDQVLNDLARLVNAQEKQQPAALLLEDPRKMGKYSPTPSIGMYRHWTDGEMATTYSAPLLLLSSSIMANSNNVIDPDNCHCTLVYEQLLQRTRPIGASAMLYNHKAQGGDVAHEISGVYREIDPLQALSDYPTPVVYSLRAKEVQELCCGYILPPSEAIAKTSLHAKPYMSICSLLYDYPPSISNDEDFYITPTVSVNREIDTRADHHILHVLVRNGSVFSSFFKIRSSFNMRSSLADRVRVMLSNYMAMPITSTTEGADASYIGAGMSFPVNISSYRQYQPPPNKKFKATKWEAYSRYCRKMAIVHSMDIFFKFLLQYYKRSKTPGGSPICDALNAYKQLNNQQPDPRDTLLECLQAFVNLYTVTGAFFNEPSEESSTNYIDERSRFPAKTDLTNESTSKYLRVFALLPPRAKLQEFVSKFKHELCVIGQVAAMMLASPSTLLLGIPKLPESPLGRAVNTEARDQYLQSAEIYAAKAVASMEMAAKSQPNPPDYTKPAYNGVKVHRVNLWTPFGPSVEFDPDTAKLKEQEENFRKEIAIRREIMSTSNGPALQKVRSGMTTALANAKEKKSKAAKEMERNLEVLDSLSKNMAAQVIAVVADAMPIVGPGNEIRKSPIVEVAAPAKAPGAVVDNLRTSLAEATAHQKEIGLLSLGLAIVDSQLAKPTSADEMDVSPAQKPNPLPTKPTELQPVLPASDDALIERAQAVVNTVGIEMQQKASHVDRIQAAEDALEAGPLPPALPVDDVNTSRDDSVDSEEWGEVFASFKLPAGADGKRVTRTVTKMEFRQIERGTTIDPASMDLYVRDLLDKHGLTDYIEFMSPSSTLMQAFMTNDVDKVFKTHLKRLESQGKPLLVMFPVEGSLTDVTTLYRYELSAFNVNGKGYNWSLKLGYESKQWPPFLKSTPLDGRFQEFLTHVGPITQYHVTSQRLSAFTTHGTQKKEELLETDARAAFYIIALLDRLFGALASSRKRKHTAGAATANADLDDDDDDDEDEEELPPPDFNRNIWTQQLSLPVPTGVTYKSVCGQVAERLIQAAEEYERAQSLANDPVVYDLSNKKDVDRDSLQVRTSEQEAFLAIKGGDRSRVTTAMARTYLTYLTRKVPYTVLATRKNTYVLPPLVIDGSESEEAIAAVCDELRQRYPDYLKLYYIFLPILYGNDGKVMASKFPGYRVGTVDEDGKNAPVPLRWELVVFGNQQPATKTDDMEVEGDNRRLIPLRIIKFLTTHNTAANKVRDALVLEYVNNLYPHPDGSLIYEYHRYKPPAKGELPDFHELSQTFAFICLKASQLMRNSVAKKLSILRNLQDFVGATEKFKTILDDIVSNERGDVKEEEDRFELFIQQGDIHSEQLDAASSEISTSILVESKKQQQKPLQTRPAFSTTVWGATFDDDKYRDAFLRKVPNKRSLSPEMVYIYANTLLERQSAAGKQNKSRRLLVLFPNVHEQFSAATNVSATAEVVKQYMRNRRGAVVDVRAFPFIIFPLIDEMVQDGNTYYKHRMYIVYNYGNYIKDQTNKCLVLEIDPTYGNNTWAAIESEEEKEKEKGATAEAAKAAAAAAEPTGTKNKNPPRLLNLQMELDAAWSTYPSLRKFEVARALAILKLFTQYTDSAGISSMQPFDDTIRTLEMDDGRVEIISLVPVKLFVKHAVSPTTNERVKVLPAAEKLREFAIDNSDANMFTFYKNLLESLKEINFILKPGRTVQPVPVTEPEGVAAKVEATKKKPVINAQKILRLLYGSTKDPLSRVKTMKFMHKSIFDPLVDSVLGKSTDQAAVAMEVEEAEEAAVDVPMAIDRSNAGAAGGSATHAPAAKAAGNNAVDPVLAGQGYFEGFDF
jgi:hypothetical protein